MIDYDRLQLRHPEVVYDLPSGGRRLVQRTDGYVATIVSGVPVYRDGESPVSYLAVWCAVLALKGNGMADRINRAIELLSQGQAIYYDGPHSGHVLTYAQGRDDAGTWADYMNVGMEHGSFDMAGLADICVAWSMVARRAPAIARRRSSSRHR